MSRENIVTYFAETDARNKKIPFGIKRDDRSRHMYVIGKTGMGKSTLLENMAVQDIRNGEGFCFLDPHGKSADLLLEYIPPERIKDVLYFAPFDMEFPISFNVMEDVGPDKRHLVANGLMSAFKKIWVDAWSARMEYILNNILLALLEYPDSTLIGVNRMLADKEYRNKVVANVTDPSVKAFWTEEYAKYTEKFAAEAAPAIQNKIGQFISNPLVRNIIGQSKSTFDIRKLMDDRKILIINLSKGRMGESNANLLGSMLITKIYLAAMSRADLSEEAMKDVPHFFLYVDEFQNFANESFADILSEARKYKLDLAVAHQYIEQMSEEVRAAVFGNVGTMVSFRVGSYDSEVLEKEFAPQFAAEDLVNLGRFQFYLKLMIDGVSSRPFSATTIPPLKKPEKMYVREIIEMSRSTFSKPRAVVEDEIRKWHTDGKTQAPPPGARGQDGGNYSGGRDSGSGRDGGRSSYSGNAGGRDGGGRDSGSYGGGRDSSSRDGSRNTGSRDSRDYNAGGGSAGQVAQAGRTQSSPNSWSRGDAPRVDDRKELVKNDTPTLNTQKSEEPKPESLIKVVSDVVPDVVSETKPKIETIQPPHTQAQKKTWQADNPQSNNSKNRGTQIKPMGGYSSSTDQKEQVARETELRKVMSLDYLKPKEAPKNNQKIASAQNISALKAALMAAMKDEAPEVPVVEEKQTKPIENNTLNTKKNDEPLGSSVQNSSESKPENINENVNKNENRSENADEKNKTVKEKVSEDLPKKEIPESVLRNILNVDEK